MKTVLITGGNRGIGKETARQCKNKGNFVIIAGRNPSQLNDTASEIHADHILVIDVSSIDSISKAAAVFEKTKLSLDAIVNNAAILLKNDISITSGNNGILSETLTTNVLGPALVINAFLPFLKSGGQVINVSSGGGSMSDDVGGWSPAYCISKSALNALTRHQAYELQSENIRVNAVCPGWTRTDMGGSAAPRPVSQGAETIVWLINEEHKFTGKFFRDKNIIPW